MGALKSYKCSKGHILKGNNLYIRINGSRGMQEVLFRAESEMARTTEAEGRRAVGGENRG